MKQALNSMSAAFSALLLSACGAPSEPQVYPETGSAAAQLYQLKCTGCHVAPQPSAHTEKTWFRVVHRMQMRMRSGGLPPLNETDLDIILTYLQRHASVEPK